MPGILCSKQGYQLGRSNTSSTDDPQLYPEPRGGMCPSEALFGIIPRVDTLPGSIHITDKDRSLSEQMRKLAESDRKARKALAQYSKDMRKAANEKRKAFDANARDFVWVSAAAMGQKESRSGVNKMSDRFYGPYEVLEKVNPTTYHVKMPATTSGRGKRREGIIHAIHLRNAMNPADTVGGKVYHPPGCGGRPADADPEGKEVDE